MNSPSITFVQLPLLTKSNLEPDEAAYYAAYLETLDHIFEHDFDHGGEVYTVDEFPLWVTRLAPIARGCGWETSFLDLARYTGPQSQLPLPKIAADLHGTNSDCFAMSPFTSNYSVARTCLEMIRQGGDHRAVLLGGAHATATARRCLADGFDAIVRGRGEHPMSRLLPQIASGSRKLNPIPGVAHIIDGAYQEMPEDMKASARFVDQAPDYTLFPSDYQVQFGRVYASLGCPYRCSFCADTLWIGMRPHFRSPDAVRAEIEDVRRRFGIDVFFLGDEVFTLRRDIAEAVAEAVAATGVKWFCQTRADLLTRPKDDGVLANLASNGCRLIQIGAESSDANVLAGLNKRVTIERVIDACARAKEAGLHVLTYWMVGGPGETTETAHETLEVIGKLFSEGLTDLADYYICTPYPGTAIYESPDAYDVKILAGDFDDWREDQPSVMRTAALSEHDIFDLWREGLAAITKWTRSARASEDTRGGPSGSLTLPISPAASI